MFLPLATLGYALNYLRILNHYYREGVRGVSSDALTVLHQMWLGDLRTVAPLQETRIGLGGMTLISTSHWICLLIIYRLVVKQYVIIPLGEL